MKLITTSVKSYIKLNRTTLWFHYKVCTLRTRMALNTHSHLHLSTTLFTAQCSTLISKFMKLITTSVKSYIKLNRTTLWFHYKVCTLRTRMALNTHSHLHLSTTLFTTQCSTLISKFMKLITTSVKSYIKLNRTTLGFHYKVCTLRTRMAPNTHLHLHISTTLLTT
jgi:hypothetical protein